MARLAFTPQRYFTTMGPHPPALRIAPGNTVVTTTVDSIGQDATGERITPGINPMTGPFFVEGAEPGDTLIVRLDRLVPNCPAGVSAPVLAPNVVDPEFVRCLPERPLVLWDVDLTRGEVLPQAPIPGLEALRHQRDQNCFGAARDRDAVPGAGEGGELAFEFLHLRAHDVLAVVEHTLHAHRNALAQRGVLGLEVDEIDLCGHWGSVRSWQRPSRSR